VAVLAAPFILIVSTSCAPATDLTNVSGSAGGGPMGNATAVLLDPAPGSSAVPVNLAALTIRFPAAVSWGGDGVRLCDGEPGLIPTAAPIEAACDGGACYRVALGAALPAAVSCAVVLAAGSRDGAGVAIPAGIIGVFDTAAAPDDTPPVIADLVVSVSGPCLAVGFSTDEPASAAVTIDAGAVQLSSPAGVGLTRFDLGLPLAPLPPASSATLVVSATDRAGNAASSPPLAFVTPGALPPLAITEVLANAAGPEPAQEYVEIRNLGADAVSLSGVRIEDGKGGDDLPGETLPPGGYALVVASAYDPAEGQDAPPRPGTPLVRVDARIGSDGLSNTGEAVKLTLAGSVVSSYGGWVDVSPSRWAGKPVHRLIETACDRADAWSRVPLDATPGAGPP